MVYTSDAFHSPSDPHGEASLLYFHVHRWMLGKSITRSTPSIMGLFPWSLQQSKWLSSWVAFCPLYILCPWRPSHLPPRATLPWLGYSLRGHSMACRLSFLQPALLSMLRPSHTNLCMHICSMVPQDASGLIKLTYNWAWFGISCFRASSHGTEEETLSFCVFTATKLLILKPLRVSLCGSEFSIHWSTICHGSHNQFISIKDHFTVGMVSHF